MIQGFNLRFDLCLIKLRWLNLLNQTLTYVNPLVRNDFLKAAAPLLGGFAASNKSTLKPILYPKAHQDPRLI